MALGWVLHLDVNAYLVLGVPLVVLFQLLIRRQPLRRLWAREATSFRLGWGGSALAAFLMLAPVPGLVMVTVPQRLWVESLWLLCAMAGAVFAAFALRQQSAKAARAALPSFIAAVLLGIAGMAAQALTEHRAAIFPPGKLVFLLAEFWSYFVVMFALEEVVFRGALDSHVYSASNGGGARGSAWLSAVFVSALWGVWHLPTFSFSNATEFMTAIPLLILFQTVVGVPLSFCWRAGGTLVLPAAAHALIDAYRNAIL